MKSLRVEYSTSVKGSGIHGGLCWDWFSTWVLFFHNRYIYEMGLVLYEFGYKLCCIVPVKK